MPLQKFITIAAIALAGAAQAHLLFSNPDYQQFYKGAPARKPRETEPRSVVIPSIHP